MQKAANDFLIGCDPEFAVLDLRGIPLNVSDLISRGGGHYKSPVGWDHSGYVVELHPRPTLTVTGQVRSLRTLLNSKELAGFLDYKWRAGGTYSSPNPGRVDNILPTSYPLRLYLGGHVHIGIMGNPFDGPPADIVSSLDSVTSLLERLDILPSEEARIRRVLSNNAYGAFSAVRPSLTRTLSGLAHLEYRTPLSWLISPEVAFTCLLVSKLACLEVLFMKRVPKYRLETASFKDLVELAETFKPSRDTDVLAFLEVLAPKGLKSLQVNPDTDIKKTWGIDRSINV